MASGSDDKAREAFRTIGELAVELDLPQHRLRYWETRFPQLRPLQRSGQRRYYRPEDITLVRRIDKLLNREGYTIRGVQRLLAEERKPRQPKGTPREPLSLRAIRDRLATALAEDSR